jgi:hypothetical protein
MWTEGFPGRTVLRLDYNAELGGIEDSLEDPIGNALGQIVDEAGGRQPTDLSPISPSGMAF